jgi:hypothetical protein
VVHAGSCSCLIIRFRFHAFTKDVSEVYIDYRGLGGGVDGPLVSKSTPIC